MIGYDTILINVYLSFLKAPTRPPGELAASWINSSAFFLSWNAPPLEHQNGIIRSYTIHITEQNTSMELLLSSPTAERVVESVHPNYDYMCIVAATTIRLGPFSTSILVRTSEDGKFVVLENSFIAKASVVIVFLVNLM